MSHKADRPVFMELTDDQLHRLAQQFESGAGRVAEASGSGTCELGDRLSRMAAHLREVRIMRGAALTGGMA